MIAPTTQRPDIDMDIDIDAIVAGTARLTAEQALHLFHHASLHDLGRWSTAIADRKMGERYSDATAASNPKSEIPNPKSIRTYVIDRNVNYTNVCTANCTFCAFKRDLGDADAYTLSTSQLHEKVAELVNVGGTQILLQGGMHPDLPIEWYENMLRGLKAGFPDVHLHAFSPPEFVEFVAIFEIDGFPTTQPGKSHTIDDAVWQAKLEAIMRRLQAAGLDSIPGGGGEIFAEHVRKKIGLGKATSQQWLDVMRCAHRLGMSTSATMMFGHIEGIADRIDHMQRVRDAQDEAIEQGLPGRYHSFISWPFQRENTPLGRLPEWDRETGEMFPGDIASGHRPSHLSDSAQSTSSATDLSIQTTPTFGKVVRMSGATDYLRTQAISRIFLDNVHSIGSSWVTMGPKIGQLGLFHGATDMGSVMMEENVVSAAGTTYCLSEEFICHLIRDAGYVPAQRDNSYNLIKVHDADGPDKHVEDWSQHRAQKLHVE